MRKDAQQFETVIIGTGFSGLLAAINLKKKSFVFSRKWFHLRDHHLLK
jgi:cation diffusion facilitator CzcD-associated flavoprotein CzcO